MLILTDIQLGIISLFLRLKNIHRTIYAFLKDFSVHLKNFLTNTVVKNARKWLLCTNMNLFFKTFTLDGRGR